MSVGGAKEDAPGFSIRSRPRLGYHSKRVKRLPILPWVRHSERTVSMRTADSQTGTRGVHPVTKFAYLGVGLLICLAPVPRQVFDVRSRHLPEWAMFAFASRDQYRVKYFYEGDEGVTFVDRREVLDLKGARPSRLQIKSKRAIYAEGQRLCQKLGVTELSARVHRSTMEGWERVRLKDNLCGRSRELRK